MLQNIGLSSCIHSLCFLLELYFVSFAQEGDRAPGSLSCRVWEPEQAMSLLCHNEETVLGPYGWNIVLLPR